MTNIYQDKTLTTGEQARKLVAANQQKFIKARGTSALAHMVAEGYVTIHKIWANISGADQARILDEHGIPIGGDQTSKYTPWVKLLWGEFDPKKTIIDSTAEERRLWVPDRSMEVYHHTMEELERLGVKANHADVIIEHGGAHAMAKKRKDRLRKEALPARQADEEVKRAVFLRETAGQWVDSNIPIPEDAGTYVTVVCRQSEGRLQLLGVVKADAATDLTRLAMAQYDELVEGMNARVRQERVRRQLEEEVKQKLVDADPDMIRRMYAKLQETAVTE